MQLTILIFSQKILPMDPMLKEFVNKSKLSSPGGKMITGISEIEDQIENFQESENSQDEIDLDEMTSRSKKEMHNMKSNFFFL